MAPQDEPVRTDETQKRLLEWGYAQPPSERLAAQVLDPEGYEDIDPAHPLGGPDDGRDGECTRNGKKGVWAVYFSRGQDNTLTKLKNKLTSDIKEARKHNPTFLVFVTNQEIRLAERDTLRALGGDIEIELFHLERVAGILDRPHMAQVRQQFLGIAAIGVAPMDIKVSVDGCAHAFTDDGNLLDAFVARRERAIRRRSDEGHERIAKENAAKEREREAREAERARAAQQKPWAVGLQVGGLNDMISRSGLFDSIAKQHTVRPDLLRIAGMEPPKPPEPLSDEQIQAKVAEYRGPLEVRWPDCRDYLASVAFPALRICIANGAEAFLTDAEIIMTFHGARGIDFKGLKAFKFNKVQDPDWQEPSGDPRFGRVAVEPWDFVRRPADYPIRWRHNADGDLVVTINLKQLRPFPEWRSDHHGDDIVLIVDPAVEAEVITVTYTATAYGYGKHFVGDEFTIPIERRTMWEVLQTTDAAASEAS
jgi:hypothetical protein